MASKRNRMTIHEWDGFAVLDLGHVEIWDGADLSLLRETLTRVIESDGRRKVGVNMCYVKYIPSGFFGMLFDWHERGVEIKLYEPQPHVGNMLWFRQFFAECPEGGHVLSTDVPEILVANTDPEWSDEVDWGFETESESIAAGKER